MQDCPNCVAARPEYVPWATHARYGSRHVDGLGTLCDCGEDRRWIGSGHDYAADCGWLRGCVKDYCGVVETHAWKVRVRKKAEGLTSKRN